MREFEKFLEERKHQCKVFTSERYMDSGDTVCYGDINSLESFIELGKDGWVGIGFGEDFEFTQETIDAFGGRLVDFMGIPLPRYRGGAHWTWAILNAEKEWGSCIQLITPEMKQGVFDNGKIVSRRVFKFDDYKTPQDLIDKVCEEGMAQLKLFVHELGKGKDFTVTEIDESKSEYYPRLNTEKDGKIDWTWNVQDIHRFICAFDKPYKGAWAWFDNGGHGLIKVHLRDCSSIVDGIHPYTSGLVVQRTEEGIYVNAPMGRLLIKDYSEEVNVGDRMY